jgi:hypothetical protein
VIEGSTLSEGSEMRVNNNKNMAENEEARNQHDAESKLCHFLAPLTLQP